MPGSDEGEKMHPQAGQRKQSRSDGGGGACSRRNRQRWRFTAAERRRLISGAREEENESMKARRREAVPLIAQPSACSCRDDASWSCQRNQLSDGGGGAYSRRSHRCWQFPAAARWRLISGEEENKLIKDELA
jgi:hypothetical protein